MPIKKSAIKEVRKNKKRRIKNKISISAMKTAAKNVRKSKTKESANKLLLIAVKKIDKNAQKGIIHKNKANRLKSRLSNFVNKLPKQSVQKKT